MSKKKILKVRVLNVPKDFKKLDISSKRSYYFKEFDEKIEFIKQLSKETNKEYTLDLELCDDDNMDIVSFKIGGYKVTQDTPTEFMKIPETLAFKDSRADERDITQEHKNQFFELLRESQAYEVVNHKNIKVKKGLNLFKKRHKDNNTEDIAVVQHEKETLEKKVEEKRRIETASKDVFGTNNIESNNVDLPDSHENVEKHEPEQINENKNMRSDTINNAQTSDSSASYSEHQLNDDIQVPEITNPIANHISKYQEEAEIVLSSIDDIEKPLIPHINMMQEHKIHFEPLITTSTNPVEKQKYELFQQREVKKTNLINNEVNMLNNSIREVFYEGLKQIELEVEEFKLNHQPDYESHMKRVVDAASEENDAMLKNEIRLISQEHQAILEKDDQNYQLERNIKVQQLEQDKNERLEQKRKILKSETEQLKTKAKHDLDASFEQDVKMFKENKLKSLSIEIQQQCAVYTKNLNWSLVDFDSETFKAVEQLEQSILQQEKEAEVIAQKQKEQERIIEENKTKQKETDLKIKQAEAEIEKAKMIKNESEKKKAELQLLEEQNRKEKLQLERMHAESEMKKAQAELEKNEIQKESNRIKELEIQSKIDQSGQLFNALYTQPNVQSNRPIQSLPKSELLSEAPIQSKKNIKSILLGTLIGTTLLGGSMYGYHEIQQHNAQTQHEEAMKKKNKTYQSFVDKHQYYDAYKIKPRKINVLESKALDTKDYVDAVKLGKEAKDYGYLMKVYNENQNVEDLKKLYQSLSYEERNNISKSTLKEATKLLVSKKSFEDAKMLNKDLKDQSLQEKIDKGLSDNKEEVATVNE